MIKAQTFNSIKAFLFYFAYQLRKYDTEEVKALLNQKLLNAFIEDNKSYLDFCMYCFYRGMYFIEKKDFYMASYFYTTAVEAGLKGNQNNMRFFNGFSTQMIRSLCFLQYLTDFDIKNGLFKERSFRYSLEDMALLEHQDVALCLEFIKEKKNDYKSFQEFTMKDSDNFNKCLLKGLKDLAEEEVIFNIVKQMLRIYKKIKLTKLTLKIQLDYDVILKILKKKVLQGEINIKYDESDDIIEVFDLDPGLKEKVEKTKNLYEKIIEGNKNMFMDLKNKKLDKISGKIKLFDNGVPDEVEYVDMHQMEQDFDE